MRHLYDQWLSSKVSKASFCRQHELHYTTFHYWIKKFIQEDSPIATLGQDNGFSRISISEPLIAADQHTHPSAVLNFPSGVRLELFMPMDASFIKSLLS
jgi:hypothetical protein